MIQPTTETPLSHHAAQAASLRTASKSSLCFLSLSVGGVRLIGFTNSPILDRAAAPSRSLPVLSCNSSQQSPAAPPAHVLATEPDLAADLVPYSAHPDCLHNTGHSLTCAPQPAFISYYQPSELVRYIWHTRLNVS